MRFHVFGLLAGMAIAGTAQAAHVNHGGSLEAVTATSLTLRLDDGRLIDARLEPGVSPEAKALVANYHLGERCQIDYTTIDPVYDASQNAYRYLRVDQIHADGRPNARQMAAVLASRGWREPGNLLTLPEGVKAPAARVYAPTKDAFLESARAAVLQYVHELPDYTVHESVQRVTQPPGADAPLTETMESDLTIEGTGEDRTHIVFDQNPWDQPFNQIPGLKWRGSYADNLGQLFALECGVKFYGSGTATVDGRRARVYDFSAPNESCVGSLRGNEQRIYAGLEGKVWLDDATQLVLRLQENSSGIPAYAYSAAGFPVRVTRDEVHWRFMTVAGVERLLETDASMSIIPSSMNAHTATVSCNYAGYHAFRAKATIVSVGH